MGRRKRNDEEPIMLHVWHTAGASYDRARIFDTYARAHWRGVFETVISGIHYDQTVFNPRIKTAVYSLNVKKGQKVEDPKKLKNASWYKRIYVIRKIGSYLYAAIWQQDDGEWSRIEQHTFPYISEMMERLFKMMHAYEQE